MDPITLLERQNFYQTGAEANQDERPSQGWQTLGATFAPGAMSANGEKAYESGMRVGAQTIDALAQARQRVNDAQQSETAAGVIEQNPDLVGGSEAAAYLAARTRAGDKAENVGQAALQFQQLREHATLGNAMASPNDRQAAAMSLAPAEAIPKAVGTAGSYTQPLNYQPEAKPGSLGSQFVNVSPQQSAINQSLISDREHQAQRPLTPPDNGKLKTGYRWQMDPNDPTQVAKDEQGNPIQEPNPAAGESAVSARYHEVVLNAANGISREAANVKGLGYDTSKGAMTMGGTHTGILNTVTDNLGKALSTTEQQQYASTMTNIGRYMAQIENAGRMPPGTMTGQLDKLAATPGTTENARLYNLALVRQNVEAGADTVNASSAAPAVKAAYGKALKSVQDSIPWTPQQVIDFEKQPAGTKFQDFISGKKPTPGAPAAGAPAGKPIDLGGGWSVVQH